MMFRRIRQQQFFQVGFVDLCIAVSATYIPWSEPLPPYLDLPLRINTSDDSVEYLLTPGTCTTVPESQIHTQLFSHPRAHNIASLLVLWLSLLKSWVRIGGSTSLG